MPSHMPSMKGSSPLTRGKLEEPGADLAQSGLIPAHAGKTLRVSARPHGPRAHPRSRGENTGGQLSGRRCVGSSPLTRGKRPTRTRPAPTRGSSPLTRGKRRFGLRGGGAGGLIPAHAGKTDGASRHPSPSRAHPRSRGENSSAPWLTGCFHGSSPLTRGKPVEPLVRGEP